MRKITILAFACLLCWSASAQKPHSDLRNEIGFNAGPFSFAGAFGIGTIGFFTAIGSAFSHQSVDMELYGHYGIHYYYQVKPWCQVGIKTTVEGARTIRYSDTLHTSVTAIDRYLLFSVMPSVRFTYLNRPWVRLYSGVDLGCAVFGSANSANADKDSGSGNFLFAFNVTAFGVNVGKKFFGQFELNAGFDSFVKVGIGARF